MDYEKHYNKLVEKSVNRELDNYSELHHIVPRCLGGSNNSQNLVKLTPEEHYVAHQLLVKMYPGNEKLVHAAMMMCVSPNSRARNNKQYG